MLKVFGHPSNRVQPKMLTLAVENCQVGGPNRNNEIVIPKVAKRQRNLLLLTTKTELNLQPPLSPRDPCRFHPVGSTQLANRLRQIIPYGAFRKIQFRGNVPASHPIPGAT